jgi:hypothetical protein
MFMRRSACLFAVGNRARSIQSRSRPNPEAARSPSLRSGLSDGDLVAYGRSAGYGRGSVSPHFDGDSSGAMEARDLDPAGTPNGRRPPRMKSALITDTQVGQPPSLIPKTQRVTSGMRNMAAVPVVCRASVSGIAGETFERQRRMTENRSMRAATESIAFCRS